MSVDTKRHLKHSDSASDSDGSEEDSVSLASSNIDGSVTVVSSGQGTKAPKKRGSRKSRQEWDIVEGLKDGQKCQEKPDRFQGYLMKRRKWPMKGWHKRFFVLERGILTYAKTVSDIQKGKYHGIIDIGLAVITFKKPGERIDIDAEEQVHHVKVKGKALFDDWLKRLRHHRLYRQHEIAYGTLEAPRLTEITSPSKEIPHLTSANLPEMALTQSLKKDVIRQSSFKASQGRVMTWLLDSAGFEQCGKNLQICQRDLSELRDLFEKIQGLPISTDSSLEQLNPETTDQIPVHHKRRGLRAMMRRERKSDSYAGTAFLKEHIQTATPSGQTTPTAQQQLPVPSGSDRLQSSASNPNLLHHFTTTTTATDSSNNNNNNIISSSGGDCSPGPSLGLNGKSIFLGDEASSVFGLHEKRIQEIRLRENFLSKAEVIHTRLKDLVGQLGTEKERMRSTLEQDMDVGYSQAASLKHTVAELQKQNSELRTKLARIHSESAVSDAPAPVLLSPSPAMPVSRSANRGTLAQSLSLDSFSLSEYYDAEENIDMSDTSSEPSDDDVSSEISEDGNETDHTTGGISEVATQSSCATGRRVRLPVPKPETPDVSMWNLLYRNIGKDLTKISMPVTLNEPLSMLQRLCEELEYSDLLDKAAEYDDPYERMIYVAAFAVSSYASSYYREGHKPFNPLLGETYECIREDKGWRFIAEQVSHHPPISACYCESRHFTFWQDVRIKTKFWGKSMEIQPLGHVHVFLPKYREHYKWNKVTTCVHNILGGQRWADQYGEMTITNNNIVCKLTFTKGANHSSSKRYEVYGNISTSDGKLVHNLFGKWNEAFFCGHASSAKCIWRPGSMPEDYELYYGFSRFAIELNELDHEMTKFLPPTDTRFRPDQRLLEEGNIQEAEAEKHRLENSQRDRRKKREADKAEERQPLWFRKLGADGKETYEYTNKYWEARKEPGFARMSFIHMF